MIKLYQCNRFNKVFRLAVNSFLGITGCHLVVVNINLSAQTFSEVETSIYGIENGTSRWADFDNDGDFDFIVAGSGRTILYRNDQGNFVVTTDSLPGVHFGSCAWGDYDNDNDLDLVITGASEKLSIGKLFRNDSGLFVDHGAAFPGVANSSVAWGDYDNDGDLDLLVTGTNDRVGMTGIYRNHRGAFEHTSILLPSIHCGEVAWGDYDNDGDLDILMSGEARPEPISEVFRNDNGRFRVVNIPQIWCYRSTVDWGDFDNDGDLDVLLAGIDWWDFFRVTKIFRNDENIFVDTEIVLTGVYDASVAWGDCDNDGDLDILLTGSGFTKIYRNDSGTFFDLTTSLIDVSNSSCSWGDYDNDGDLDILLTGTYASAPVARIYKNNCHKANTPPSAPINLKTEIQKNTVTLSWDAASDNQTPPGSLTYNLRMGTEPGKNDIVTPMAITGNVENNGFRLIPAMGNTNHNRRWSINNLAPGTFYWSVQAIDHGFAGSRFAEEASFTITGDSNGGAVP